MDLANIAHETLNELNDSGKIKEIVEKQLISTVTSITSDLMRDWSPFGKQVKDKIESALNLDLAHLDLQDYNALVHRAIHDTLMGSAYQSMEDRVRASVAEVTGMLDKKEWKLSDIVRLYKAHTKRWDDGKGVFVQVDEETSYGSRWVRLGTTASNDRYSSFLDDKKGKSEYRLLVSCVGSSDKMHTLSAYWKDGVNSNLFSGSPEKSEFDKTLFRLWAGEATIQVDFDETESAAQYDDDDND